MKLGQDDKIALSGMRMDKANKFLSDAVANNEGGRYETAVNRSYSM